MRYAVIIYTDTTSKAAVSDYMERLLRDKQRESRRQQRRQYFLKQRLTGIFLLLFTILAVMLTGGDATIAIITVPLGLYLVFTKEMVIESGFHRETKEREIRNDTDIRAFRGNR